MKYLYIVDYWVPYPSSESGGIINVIAENDVDCFNQLSEEPAFDQTYIDRIMPAVTRAQKVPLAEEFESGIIEAFTT